MPLRLFAVLLVAWALLLTNLGGPSFSVDEFINVEIERGTLSAIFADLKAGRDLHPPLSHLLMAPWLQMAGDSEWSARFLPVAMGFLSLALLWQLADQWLDRRKAWLAPALLAIAPSFQLYVRFEKYYALTMAVALLLIVCTRRWQSRPSTSRLVALGIVTVALFYTDYLAALFLTGAAGLLLFLASWRADRRLILRWIIVQFAAALCFLPWLSTVAAQTTALRGLWLPDLGGTPADFVLKLGAAGLSFGLGETLFPWRPLGALGLLASATLAATGVLSLCRRRGGIALLAYLLLPVIGGALLLTTWAPNVPFMAFPNHVLFVLPIASLLLAVGAWHLSPKMRVVAVMAWGVAAMAGLLNYHAGTDFINPIYAVPTREIAATVKMSTGASPGAVVLAEQDTGLPFYLNRQSARVPVMTPGEVPDLRAYPAEVWLFSFGRDRSRIMEGDARARNWLAANGYVLADATKYVPTDPTYGSLKSRLLRREVYDAKATLEQWKRVAGK